MCNNFNCDQHFSLKNGFPFKINLNFITTNLISPLLKQYHPRWSVQKTTVFFLSKISALTFVNYYIHIRSLLYIIWHIMSNYYLTLWKMYYNKWKYKVCHNHRSGLSKVIIFHSIYYLIKILNWHDCLKFLKLYNSYKFFKMASLLIGRLLKHLKYVLTFSL